MNKKSILYKTFWLVVLINFVFAGAWCLAQDEGKVFDDELNPVYTLAVTMFKKGRYDKAKELFLKISQKDPGYQSTSEYLAEIEAKENPSVSSEGLLVKKTELDTAESDAYKKQLLQAYKEGVYLFNIKKYDRAQEKFEMFLKAYPGEKHALQYLLKTKEAIAERNRKVDDTMRAFHQIEEGKKPEAIVVDREKEQRAQERLKMAEEARQREQEYIRQRRLAALYRIAKRDYGKERYSKAEEYFLKIQEMDPDYRSTNKYLASINELLIQKKEELQNKINKDFAQELKMRRLIKDRELAAAQVRQQGEKSSEKDKAVKQETEEVYAQAKALYRAKDYAKALEKFKEVEMLLPGYRSTANYLKKIQQFQTEGKRKEEEKAPVVAKKIEPKEPSKKQATSEIEEKQLKQSETKKQQAKDLYAQAKDLYRAKAYAMALEKFKEVETLSPGYGSAANYLKKIEKIQLSEKRKAQEKLEMASKTKEPQEQGKGSEVSGADAKAVESVEDVFEVSAQESDEYIKALEKKIETTRKKILGSESSVSSDADTVSRNADVKKVDQYYVAAVDKYHDKKFQEAKKDFEMVEKLSADYKATRSYIMMIDARLYKQDSDNKEKEILEESYNQAVFSYKRKQYESALSQFVSLSKGNPHYKDVSDYIKKCNYALTEEKQKEKEHMAEALYDDAVKLYKSNHFQTAQEKFLAVNDLVLDYKSTDRYLKKIKKQMLKSSAVASAGSTQVQPRRPIVKDAPLIASNDDVLINQAVEKREQEILGRAEGKYRLALSFYNDKNFVEAKRKFIEVEAIYPAYKDTSSFLERIDDDIVKANISGVKQGVHKSEKSWIPSIFEKNLETPQKNTFEAEAQDIYNQALTLYKHKDYARAQSKFESVQQLIAHYKKSDTYLKKISKNLAVQKKQEARDRKESKNIEVVKKEKTKEEVKASEKIKEFDQKRETDANIAPLPSLAADAIQEEKSISVKQVKTAKEAMAQKTKISERKMKKADKLMDKALEHYREGDYKKARKMFASVDEMIPDYKSSKRYISTLDKMIFQKEMEEKLVVQQKKQAAEEKIAEEPKAFHEDKLVEMFDNTQANKKEIRKEAEKTRKMLQEERTALDKEKTKLLKDQIHRQEKLEAKKAKEKNEIQTRILNEKYKEAVDFYKQRKFRLAKQRFNEIYMIDPKFKSADLYLKEIERKVEEAQKFLVERMTKKKEMDAEAPQNIDPVDVNFEAKNQAYNEKAVHEIIAKEVIEKERPLYEYSKKEAIAFLEAEESLNYRKKWDKKRKDLAREQMLEEKRKEEAKRKLEEKMAKQKAEREEALAKEKEEQLKEAKARVDELFKDAISLYREKEADKYLEKMKELNGLLEDEIFDGEYVKQVKADFDKEKMEIQESHAKEQQEREAKLHEEEEKLAKLKEDLKKEKSASLEKLEKKIRLEETRIEEERKREQDRLRSVELQDQKVLQDEFDTKYPYAERREALDAKITRTGKEIEKTNAVAVDVDYVHPLLEEVRESQASRGKELQRTIERKSRQYERAQVDADRDLKSTLATLYERAVKLFEAQNYLDANRIFEEIKKMAPSYKNTDEYILKSQRNMSSTVNSEKGASSVSGKESFELPAVLVYPK